MQRRPYASVGSPVSSRTPRKVVAAISRALSGGVEVSRIDLSFLVLLAEGEEVPPPPGFGSMMPALAVIMLLFYFLILRPQKNKDQAFRSMVDSLKETDRVVTIGGIHGVVTSVQREAETVTIRVDKATGTKIRVGGNVWVASTRV